VKHELQEGIDVGWDLVARKADPIKLKDIDGVAHLKYAYPGKRNICKPVYTLHCF
jgi:hypothetical protein